ncbi:MAG: SDR family oxidoreductase [Parvularculaceae bacterium]
MPHPAPNKSAVVTGASSGIGRAICEALLNDGWRVFGSFRKADDDGVEALAAKERFSPLVFDVTNEDAIASAAKDVETALAGARLGGLVNNAGVAVTGPAECVPLDDYRFQFDVNVFGPVRVAQAFLPLLGTRDDLSGPPGKIVNMSSIAGKIATPFFTPYAMSKHALEAYGDALRREMILYGVDVVTVGPGSVKTPIWDKADAKDDADYADTAYAPLMRKLKENMKTVAENGLEPEAVGSLVRDILNGDKKKARYAIVKNPWLFWRLPRLLPTRLLDRILADRNGIAPKTG